MQPTDVIQAVCAIATLILTILVMLQNFRIKTLTDVVEELREQTKLLAADYSLKLHLTRRERMPFLVFTSRNATRKSNNYIEFQLQNKGQKVYHFQPNKEKNKGIRMTRNHMFEVRELQLIELAGELTHDGKPDFEVIVSYETHDNESYEQTIKCKEWKLSITQPKLIE